jgi:hypothetical protein
MISCSGGNQRRTVNAFFYPNYFLFYFADTCKTWWRFLRISSLYRPFSGRMDETFIDFFCPIFCCFVGWARDSLFAKQAKKRIHGVQRKLLIVVELICLADAVETLLMNIHADAKRVAAGAVAVAAAVVAVAVAAAVVLCVVLVVVLAVVLVVVVVVVAVVVAVVIRCLLQQMMLVMHW